MCEFIIYYMHIEKTKCGLSTEVHSFGGHQTHAVVGPGFGEMAHYGPLVLFRVVDNHVSKPLLSIKASCGAPGVKIITSTSNPFLCAADFSWRHTISYVAVR